MKTSRFMLKRTYLIFYQKSHVLFGVKLRSTPDIFERSRSQEYSKYHQMFVENAKESSFLFWHITKVHTWKSADKNATTTTHHELNKIPHIIHPNLSSSSEVVLFGKSHLSERPPKIVVLNICDTVGEGLDFWTGIVLINICSITFKSAPSLEPNSLKPLLTSLMQPKVPKISTVSRHQELVFL